MNTENCNTEIACLLELRGTFGIAMDCPKCGAPAKYVGNRGFADGSGLTFTCAAEGCANRGIYFYPR